MTPPASSLALAAPAARPAAVAQIARPARPDLAWRRHPVAQPVPWPDDGALRAAERQLATRPPLVASGDCRRLGALLAGVAGGHGLVLQGGPCAESFRDDPRSIDALASLLAELAAAMRSAAGVPVLTLARLAGQYSKPRSAMSERVGGQLMPTFRGHSVHDDAPDAAARRPDPARLVEAYHRSRRTLRRLADGAAPFTCHEALLLEYEEALTRRDAGGEDWYATSAHLLWAGERTRAADGAHIAYLAEIANPVAVKLGPAATADDVAELCRRLDPQRRPGRLTFVTRLGAERVGAVLPALVEAARDEASPVTWLCDPMHANTRTDASAAKYRRLSDMLAELEATAAVHRAARSRLGGLHLEVTADDVLECVDDEHELAARRYGSLCDPRLNARQARRLVGAISRELG